MCETHKRLRNAESVIRQLNSVHKVIRGKIVVDKVLINYKLTFLGVAIREFHKATCSLIDNILVITRIVFPASLTGSHEDGVVEAFCDFSGDPSLFKCANQISIGENQFQSTPIAEYLEVVFCLWDRLFAWGNPAGDCDTHI